MLVLMYGVYTSQVNVNQRSIKLIACIHRNKIEILTVFSMCITISRFIESNLGRDTIYVKYVQIQHSCM